MTEQMPPVPFVPSEYARAGREWTRDTVHEVMMKLHPFLASFPRQRMTEFPDPDTALPDSTDYRQTRIHHVADMTRDTALTFDVEAVEAVIHEVADAWGAQQSRFMIQMISDSATAAGNVVETGTDPWEQYIEALTQIEMDFDDKGESSVVLLVSPQMKGWMEEHPPTPEQQTRIDAIFSAKKEAHRAARDRRRFS